MSRRVFKATSGILVLVILVLAGCEMYQPGHGNALDPGPKSVQKLVEDKIAEQETRKTGAQRWQDYRKDQYQDNESITRNRRTVDDENRRKDAAEQVIRSGRLNLVDSLEFALEFNDQIQAHRAVVKSTGGDALIVRSRFLPKLFYNLNELNVQHKAVLDPADTDADLNGIDRTRRHESFFRYCQTLLEFGKDNPQDVLLRQQQRTALFAYEETVRQVLNQVRLKYFTILLRKRQLDERTNLLRGFQKDFNRIQGKYKKRQVVEVDVLTARLNVLNEETRINTLKKEILRQKIDLTRLVGFPVGKTGFEPVGDLETLNWAPDQIVKIALERSTEVAQAQAVVTEQERRARQTLWEYGPDMNLETGWKDKNFGAGLRMLGEDGSYNVSSFSEQHMDHPRDGFVGSQGVLGPEQDGWYLGLGLEMPVFKGLERKGRTIRETALLDESRYQLRDAIDLVDADVRKSYQTLLEQRETLAILAERVQISRQRLRTKERLKELDRGVTDNELETFREQYFRDQDDYFARQIEHVAAQEQLRALMRYFEPIPKKEVRPNAPKP